MSSTKSLHWLYDINGSRRSSLQADSYQQKGQDVSDDETVLDDIVIENGNIQQYDNDDGRVKSHENRVTGFIGGLFSCTRLPVTRRTRTEGRFCPSRIAGGLMGSFRKIRRVASFYEKRRYYRRRTWIGCWDREICVFLFHTPHFHNRLKAEFFLSMQTLCVFMCVNFHSLCYRT